MNPLKTILFVLALIPISLFSQTTPEKLSWEDIDDTTPSDIILSVMDKLDIPVFQFHFLNDDLPTYDVIYCPPGCVGKSITNNEYVNGSLTISLRGEILYESGDYSDKNSGVRVKCRGNTSTAETWYHKKSYKIKLSKKADLLFRGDKDFNDKDWVLLGRGSIGLNTFTGFETGRLCGMPWEPEGRLVCVFMNDNYMGTFYLTETIKQGEQRVNIKNSGFIVENDAYWWKPDEVYFKTEHFPDYMGWTFKEPDPDDFDEDTLANIREVIDTFESALYSNGDIWDMYDAESFASWLLAHDILGSSDGAGSNIFVIKENMNPSNMFQTKLKMGPLWDFDDCMKTLEGFHAVIYRSNIFWFPQLLTYSEFQKAYLSKWNDIKTSIHDNVLNGLKTYLEKNPEIDKMRFIDYQRHLLNDEQYTLSMDDYIGIDEWFKSRLATLENLNTKMEEAGIEDINYNKDDRIIATYNLQGQKVDNTYKGVVIKRFASGKTIKTIQ